MLPLAIGFGLQVGLYAYLRQLATWLVLIGILAIGGAYSWMEHGANLLGALVWLPLLACPLMHFFMHHGHGGHSGHGRSPSDREAK